MPKVRILVFLSTILIVSFFGLIASYYARGYKFDRKNFRFTPNGIMVVNSDPNGAGIYVDSVLKTATDATISLAPGTYKIEIKKDGFLTWSKKMTIQKEEVTEIDASLFPAAPSLSALTFSGVINPVSSHDATRIAYVVPPTKDNLDKAGLWVTEVNSLPIGFSRDPKRITDGDLTDAQWVWSPDGKEILLTTKGGIFLLDPTEFVNQSQRVNISTQADKIKETWQGKELKKLDSQLANLPDELAILFKEKTTNIIFSPDETKILYTATDSAKIPEGLIPALPGASTQNQTRELKKNVKYIFDIKEDRNFEIAGKDDFIYWLGTSRHLVIPQKDKVVISDYDNTNRQTIYSGSYIFPHAYPNSISGKLLILTNLGSIDGAANLYHLNLK